MTHASGQPILENLLAALTDAIIEDEQDIDVIVNRYGIPRADVERFIHLIRRLHVVLVGVHPSRRFAHRLRQDLLGQPERNVIKRVRYLPPRVQIAASVALIAGFMLLSRRRLATDLREAGEAPALQ